MKILEGQGLVCDSCTDLDLEPDPPRAQGLGATDRRGHADGARAAADWASSAYGGARPLAWNSQKKREALPPLGFEPTRSYRSARRGTTGLAVFGV